MHPDPHSGQHSSNPYPVAPSFYPEKPAAPMYPQSPMHPQTPMYPQPPMYPHAPMYPQQNAYPQTPPMDPVYAGTAPFGIDRATGIPYSDKSRTTAGLLQLFLGAFGVGRWYIGSNGIAAAQLCLWLFGCVTTIVLIGFLILAGVTIWVLVDAIMMFTGSVRDGDGRVLR